MLKRYHFNVVLIAIGLAFAAYGCLDTNTGVGEDSNQFVSQAAPGGSAQVFLSDSSFTNLELEIDYMPEHQPSQQALDSLKSFLQERLNKSEIVIQTPSEVQSGGGGTYSAAEIRTFEEEYRDNYTDSRENTLYAYMLIVDGRSQEQDNVLGITYYNTSMAFFGESFNEASSGVGAPSKAMVEGTVFQHEFGHTLGLVGSGAPTQSEHKTAGSAHCTAEGCLMESTVETTNYFFNLFGGSIPELDEQCIADLQANGGK